MTSNPLAYPFPKLVLGLMVGILFQKIFTPPPIIVAFGLVISILAIIFFQLNYSYKTKIWGHWLSLVLAVNFGAWSSILSQPILEKNHYSHILKLKNKVPKLIVLQIKTILNPSAYDRRYFAHFVQWDSTLVSGKVVLNIQKDSLQDPILVDDTIALFTTLKTIAAPKNPHGFNYARFLDLRGVKHQISVKSNEILIQKSSKKSLLGRCAALKTKLESKIDDFYNNSTSKAFLKAFFLGNRSEIPENIKTDYKNAGVLHVLALSGLHVGIILLLLRIVFKPLLRIHNGKILRSAIIVIVLWGFAIITGLSPSIVRAVFMFSCFAMADGLNRKTNSINTLSISAFFMLIIHPNYLFDVGFQLSYSAVLGILILKPVMDEILTFQTKGIEFFNTILKVSLTAQIGILPFGLYYFHQFSGLFFLANLLVIPSLIVLIWLGLIIVFFNISGVNIGFINRSFDNGLEFINRYIEWVASIDFFILKSITFDQFMLFLSLTLAIVFFKFLTLRTFKNFTLIVILILIFQGYYFYEYKMKSKTEFIIFNQFKTTVLGFRNGNFLEIHQSESIPAKFIEDYIIGEGIEKHKIQPLKPLYRVFNNNLLLVNSLGVFDFKSPNIDWVLLQFSPKIHLEMLIETLHPKRIIADGSNYQSDILRWKETCNKYGIPCHDTTEEGAFIFP